MASTSGPASAEEAALSSLNSHSPEELQMAEDALRDVLMAKVQALAAEHGEGFIQSLIQREISRTKRMETELATVKKRLGAEERAVDELRLEVRKVKVQEEKCKHMCHGLQETVKKREQLMEEMGAEMEKHRSSIRDRVTENVQNMLADCEKRRESVEATEAEVAELEAALEHQKEAFEQSFADFQNGLKGHTEEYQGLIDSYQESAKRVELLEARLMLVRREHNSVEMTRASLHQQLEVYEKQFQGFADSVMRPEDVEALAKRQSEQAQLRIAQMEADKANVHQQRLQMDKELTDLRAKHASLKRTMQQLEKVKTAAEKKCRLAQQSLQEKNSPLGRLHRHSRRLMRRSLQLWCSRVDLDGKPSRYFPRFRPRRLVMPVDPSDVHSDKRQPNPLFMKVKEQKRLRRRAEMRGAVQLASVPKERTVGDVFRLLMAACEAQGLFSDAALTPLAVRELDSLVEAHSAASLAARQHSHEQAASADIRSRSGAASAEKQVCEHPDDPLQHSSPLYTRAFQVDSSPVAASSFTSASGAHTLSIREVDQMWSMLDRTPLNSSVHGALALRGDALVRSTLLELTYSAYPRLRSKHVQQLLHETTGLLPCGRIATRIGLAEHCGVEGDIAMWRELNILSERMRIARKEATAHLQRIEKGVAAQRRWYWRAVLRSAAGRLKLFPVHKEDLQPRMQWVRSLLFSFVAFVEMAETSGDTHARVRPLIYQLFASQLARHVRVRRITDAAEAIASSASVDDTRERPVAKIPPATSRLTAPLGEFGDGVAALRGRIEAELARVKSRTADEEEVLEGRTHPMNNRADRQRDQFESSGGAHGTQMLKDEMLEGYTEHYSHLAPPLLLHALELSSANAFKEVQLVLRYAPQVSENLRRAPIDVDQTVRRIVDIQETNNYASLHTAQQYRQVEYTMCRLYAGHYCLGEGKGETLMMAMQDASMQMLMRYYLRSPSSAPTPFESKAQGGKGSGETFCDSGSAVTNTVEVPAHEEGDSCGVPAPRIHPPKTEEEIVL